MTRDELTPEFPLRIVESRAFTRRRDELFEDEEYRALQIALLLNPRLGPVVPGTGGVRKLRWSVPGRGKRGGVRVIYYHAASQRVLALLHVYTKNESEDLTSDQKAALRKLVEAEYG